IFKKEQNMSGTIQLVKINTKRNSDHFFIKFNKAMKQTYQSLKQLFSPKYEFPCFVAEPSEYRAAQKEIEAGAALLLEVEAAAAKKNPNAIKLLEAARMFPIIEEGTGTRFMMGA